MGTAKDFFIQLPYLCHARNAERWSKINAMQFETELAGGTLFDRNDYDIENAFNRLETAFGFVGFAHDKARTAYCKILAELFVRAHYKMAHGEKNHDKHIENLISEGMLFAGDFPDIDAVMTVEKAAGNEGWS